MITDDNFVWNTLCSALPSKHRFSATQFTNFNCPMCVSRGETPDKKYRCGVKRDYNGIVVSCWNCKFVAKWVPGEMISKNFRDFLEQIGVGRISIMRMNHQSLLIRKSLGTTLINQPQQYSYNYPEASLPPDSFTLAEWAEVGCDNIDYINTVEYMFSRGTEIADPTKFYWSPTKDMQRRLIIPFYCNGIIVGWTGRSIDKNIEPRYWNSSLPENLLFNIDTLSLKRKYTIIVEGPFDALAIDGVGTLGGKISNGQINRISISNQIPIVLADRDSTGNRVIDIALKNNWMVSFPKLKDGAGNSNWWEHDVKDASEAVLRYGRWYTLQSIFSSTTSNKLEINVKRKLLYS